GAVVGIDNGNFLRKLFARAGFRHSIHLLNTMKTCKLSNSIRNHSTEQFGDMQPKSISHNCESPNVSGCQTVKDCCESSCSAPSLVLTVLGTGAYYSPLFARFRGV